jgi:hypothetical protein
LFTVLCADELIPLSELPKHIPPSRNGKRRHKSSVYRYAKRGVRGIKLEVRQLPDGLYTTMLAWERFIGRLTAARCGSSVGTSPPPRTQTKRQSAVEKEIEAVRASLRQKKGGQ